MDATQNRLNNYLSLFEEFKAANPHLPQRGMHKLFCEKVEISARYLAHVRLGRKNMGSATARQIEKRCGKPFGWMDARHGEHDPRGPEEQYMVDQILMLYRNSPEAVQKLIRQAIEDVLGPPKLPTQRRA